jgi:hypothetical protein
LLVVTNISCLSELGPAQEFQQAVSGGFNNLFAAAAAGGDIAPTISAISKSVADMGGSSEKVGPYLEAMAGLMKIISPNPTEEQKNEIFEASSQSLAASIELIRSQPGLNNFDTDERLQSIPEIADFFKSLESMFSVAAHISIDPTSANGYYTNPDFGAQSAQFISSLLQASQTAKTLPELTTSKCSFIITSHIIIFSLLFQLQLQQPQLDLKHALTAKTKEVSTTKLHWLSRQTILEKKDIALQSAWFSLTSIWPQDAAALS